MSINPVAENTAEPQPIAPSGVAELSARKQADSLLAAERQCLELIARGKPLDEILDTICSLMEEQLPSAMCSILLLDEGRRNLRAGAAPSLPSDYADALDGLAIGECAGSCGTAAYFRKQVIVSDIASDPLWSAFRELAQRHGVKACWSTPIFAQDKSLLGTLAVSHRKPRSPGEHDLRIIDVAAYLAGIGIERVRAAEAMKDLVEALQASEERLRSANDQITTANFALERRVAERTTELEADIAVRKEAEARLRESEERFRNLIEGSIQGILIHRDFKPLFVNEAYAKILGYDSSDAICAMQSIEPIIAPHDVPRLRAIKEARMRGDPAPDQYEYDALGKDGNVVALENVVRLVNWDGRPAIQNVVIDVTQRKRFEAERLAHAKQQRDVLVREVHHRIKNNLQGVLGLLQEHGRAQPLVATVLEKASSQVAAVAMVHGLQAKSRAEAVTLSELVSSISSSANHPYPVSISCDTSAERLHCVRLTEPEAVPVALIINELITNAIKHMGHTEERDRAVKLHLGSSDNAVRLEVENPGAALPDDFDFDTGSGLGTGLELVKSLMPPEGARLCFNSDGRAVSASLDLMPPVVTIREEFSARRMSASEEGV